MEKREETKMENENKVIQETNQHIFKYQKEDIIKKLTRILGDDFAKYREEFNKTQDYENTKYVPDFPLCVALELVNRCNLNCIMCNKDHHKEELAKISLETLKKILDECKENKCPSLIWGMASEPLMYAKVPEVFQLIKESEIQDVFFGTNGILLTDEIIELIVKNQITRVEISLDAATPETYKNVRGFDKLDVVEKNIHKLIECKKKYNSELPIIRLCFVVMDINKHEVQPFLEKWKDKVDYVDFQRYIDFKNPVPGDKVDINKMKIKRCSYPFYLLGVSADGNVTPCASKWGEENPIGNIYNQSLKEIWNCDKLNELRQDLIECNLCNFCKECLYAQDDHLIDEIFPQA